MSKDTCATCAFAHSFSYIIYGGEGLGDCDYHCCPCHEEQTACDNYKDEEEDYK
jgi:hypothetical protein